jgi:polyhydroxybutyrate depolymerase
VFILLFGFMISLSCAEEESAGGNAAAGTRLFQVTVKGVQRNYLAHIPASCRREKKWPVVVMFHGGGGTAGAAMRETGWNEKADKEGFLAVFPEGTPPDLLR